MNEKPGVKKNIFAKVFFIEKHFLTLWYEKK